MKELKHLIYFESLLEDTNNELVRKAESEGDLALGYTCFHAPEVLMNLGTPIPWSLQPITWPTTAASSPVRFWSARLRATTHFSTP